LRGSRPASSLCYFTVNSRLVLVIPFVFRASRFLFTSLTRPIVLFMRVFLLVRYNGYSTAIDRLCAIVYLPIVPLCSFIPAICDAMTKTNAFSLAIVMYILCRRSLVQSQTIIISVDRAAKRFISRNNKPSLAISRRIYRASISLYRITLSGRNFFSYLFTVIKILRAIFNRLMM